MNKISDYFGSMVFSDAVMKQRLPAPVYDELCQSVRTGKRLSAAAAQTIATAMKDWALEKGATHYTHWFQPMTGVTAEKHDSFLSQKTDGTVLEEFSGRELIHGEPDASSLPSGGLRATFEARGYTAWDPTSYAFIKDGVLCVPTAFCSYGGEALDKKTPLLRSMEALNRQALRVLALFGRDDIREVRATCGAEQEYFLIDKACYYRRKDLIYTGRTLFGVRPPKGQELDDHYFGAIRPRVAAFMRELDEELWKCGVSAKTEHNETAPAQHELAPLFNTVNIAADHNQIMMEFMRRIAEKHDMVCLLHEKPFEGVNGSGKHNNWSLASDTGENLLEPGDTPARNAQFLTFLCAVLQAVNEYQELLRISVASAGNDHRLGGDEAPPAIVSVYLGDELGRVLEAIEAGDVYDHGEKEQFRVGVSVLPRFPKDSTDRNRTSPFAFTGNKFEFRMPGSEASVSEPNTVLNTIVAEELCRFADRLEAAQDVDGELRALIRETVIANRRILFNGNGYDDSWVREARQRGLADLRTTPDALAHYLEDKNVALFEKHRVLTRREMQARHDIVLGEYCKRIRIEAQTMITMCGKDILPAVSRFAASLSDQANKKQRLGLNTVYETDTAGLIADRTNQAYRSASALRDAVAAGDAAATVTERAALMRDEVLVRMRELRTAVDDMEAVTDRAFWPYPSCGEILFSV